MRLLSVLLVSLSTFIYSAFAAAPITSLSVTLRGQRYDIDGVTTVRDLQEQLEQKSGIHPKQQGRVIFGGKSLTADAILEEAGVPNDGSASLTIVPSTVSKTKKSKTAKKSSASSTKGSSSSSSKAKDSLKSPSFDKNRVEEMMKKMGGEGMPSMEDSIKSMTEAMKNPMIQQMLSDPEQLEQMRKMLQQNPMLKSMMGNMPGFDDLLNDPDAFREAMQASADLYKNMDSDTLLSSMMGGAASGSGLFDGSLDNSASAAALDELDEDD